jgi:lambda repressor-like predicted transcriptional regulator
MTTTLDALRQAAAILLANASESIVRRTLQSLLNTEAAEDAPPSRQRQRRRGMRSANKARTPPPDWPHLRIQVRNAMRERGVSLDTLAQQIGFARSTTRNTLSSTRKPSAPIQAKLTDWLARAEEASVKFPFHPAGAGNGAGSARADA